MPTIRTQSAPDQIEVVYDEWPSPDVARTLLKELRGSGHLTAGTTMMVDLRPVKQLPRQEELRLTIDAVSSQNHWPLRRAYLVLPGAQYGVMRQMQAQLPEDIVAEIFTDEAAARAWCGNQWAMGNGQ
jgi:hypothetical protein